MNLCGPHELTHSHRAATSTLVDRQDGTLMGLTHNSLAECINSKSCLPHMNDPRSTKYRK